MLPGSWSNEFMKWPHSETYYVSIYKLRKSYWMYPITIQSAPFPVPCAASPVPDSSWEPRDWRKGAKSDTTFCYHGIMSFVSSQLLGSCVPHEIPNEVFINLSILFLWNFSSRLKYTSLAENSCISESCSAGRAGTSCRHTATSCGKSSKHVTINNLWNYISFSWFELQTSIKLL